jgi:ferredoxin
VRIAADRDVCIGSGNCVYSAPEVFDQDDDGIVLPLATEVGPEHADAVRDAVANCPSGALRILED